MTFNINQNLDLDKISQAYARDSRIKISNFLTEQQAKKLSQCLSDFPNYRHAFVLAGRYGEASAADLRALPKMNAINSKMTS